MIINYQILERISPRTNGKIAADLSEFLVPAWEKYEINTKLRVANFLGQFAEETAGYATLEEYASGANYEGRKDLGNVKRGDGKRYKGRGGFMLTGRANYQRMTDVLKVDFINHPEWASEGKYSVLISCEYWKEHNLNHFADMDDEREITRKINGGFNGLSSRLMFTKRAKNELPAIFAS